MATRRLLLGAGAALLVCLFACRARADQLRSALAHPVKVFGGVAEAMQWLSPHVRALCGPTLRIEELSSALEQHLGQFQARTDRPQIVLPG